MSNANARQTCARSPIQTQGGRGGRACAPLVARSSPRLSLGAFCGSSARGKRAAAAAAAAAYAYATPESELVS